MEKLGKGTIAKCSLGRVGVIMTDEPKEITYDDGNTGVAWTGFHIWPPEWFGKPWSSRTPTVVMNLEE